MFKSFRARMAATFGLLFLLVTAGLSYGVGELVSARLEREQGDALEMVARSTAAMLAEGLHERAREVTLIANSDEAIRLGRGEPAAWRPVIERLRQTRTHYAWIGVTDADGKVVAATRDMLLGQAVAARPWWQAGRHGPHVGDVHAAKLLASLLPTDSTGEPMRFIDFAAPLHDSAGQLRGVLGVHVGWDWVRDVIAMVRSDHDRERGLLVFILDRKGQLIHRPREAATAALADGDHLGSVPGLLRWQDGQQYLTASVPLKAQSPLTDLGWTIVVRQPAAEALHTATAARRTVLAGGAAATLVLVLLACVMADRLGRPLARIATAAQRIQQGERGVGIPLNHSSTELERLSASLHSMTSTLVEREQALAGARDELERRVVERTAELAEANSRLEALASRDGLTGLFNRRAADDRLANEIARHRRSGRALGVVLLDVDHFKRVNDTHGHAAGDEVLHEVACRLVGASRSTDFVARFGGEEFLVLLPETDADGAAVAAEKLRAAIEAGPIGAVGRVTASLGLCVDAQAHGGATAALKAADEALYDAKTAGRNRVVRAGIRVAAAAALVDA
ncbi:MAG: diguanylate cyclase [Piscinibacter sp.]